MAAGVASAGIPLRSGSASCGKLKNPGCLPPLDEMNPDTNPAVRSGPPSRPALAGEKFQRLVEIMARLRAPNGCPWDREQSFDTIKPYLLEETYEVLDAIDGRDWPALAEELGDLLLEAVFFAQMASEQVLFDAADALDHIN